MFLCWLRAVRSGENQGLYLFLVVNFLNGACLFWKREEKEVSGGDKIASRYNVQTKVW
jgi:hypothetical protein